MEQALAGVKVLDLTWRIAGPYCTKLLADYGADVIKVERPGSGDPARSMGPFLGDEPHPEKSGLFLHLNTNKRGITLNLKSQTGKKIIEELVKGVDILVESFRPRVMPSLGLGYPELAKINPMLVMVSISNFGQTGPYRDYKASELIIYGMGGSMYYTGIPEREPLKLGGTVAEYQVGNTAMLAALIALYDREVEQRGHWVDVSAFECHCGSGDRRAQGLQAYLSSGDYDRRVPAIQRAFPSGTYPCQDGYIDITGYGVVFFPRAARMIGRPELTKDPRFSTPMALVDLANKEVFEAEYWLPWLLARTKREVWAAAQQQSLLSGPVLAIDEVADDLHYKFRGCWVEIEHPVAGRLRYPGQPIRMGENPWLVRRPAPLLGQHNAEVYGSLGYSKEDLVKLKEAGVI